MKTFNDGIKNIVFDKNENRVFRIVSQNCSVVLYVIGRIGKGKKLKTFQIKLHINIKHNIKPQALGGNFRNKLATILSNNKNVKKSAPVIMKITIGYKFDATGFDFEF